MSVSSSENSIPPHDTQSIDQGDTTTALLAELLPIVISFMGPCVIWLIK